MQWNAGVISYNSNECEFLFPPFFVWCVLFSNGFKPKKTLFVIFVFCNTGYFKHHCKFCKNQFICLREIKYNVRHHLQRLEQYVWGKSKSQCINFNPCTFDNNLKYIVDPLKWLMITLSISSAKQLNMVQKVALSWYTPHMYLLVFNIRSLLVCLYFNILANSFKFLS